MEAPVEGGEGGEGGGEEEEAEEVDERANVGGEDLGGRGDGGQVEEVVRSREDA